MLTPRGVAPWAAGSLAGDGTPGVVLARGRREEVEVVVVVAAVGSRRTRSIRTNTCFPVLRSMTMMVVCVMYRIPFCFCCRCGSRRWWMGIVWTQIHERMDTRGRQATKRERERERDKQTEEEREGEGGGERASNSLF